MRVFIGPVRLPDQNQEPTLLVEAQTDRLEALRKRWGPGTSGSEVVWKQALLAASEQAVVTWFLFNDERLNGVVPLERWQPLYPNLQLTGQIPLSTQTLAGLLDGWQHALDDSSGIELILAQGDPLEVLKGAGPWIRRLVQIELQGPRAAEMWADSCDAWLQQQGFRHDPHNHLRWNLDPIGANLIRQQTEIQALQVQHEQEMRNLAERSDKLLAALRHIFPDSTYRKLRPDLAGLTGEELLDHYVCHGINEEVNLKFSSINNEMQILQSELSEQAARLSLIHDKSRHTAQQLDLLKELIGSLMVNP